MNNLIKRSLFCSLAILVILWSGADAGAELRLIDDFSQELRPAWQVKTFQGKTSYQLAVEDNIPCLKARSNGTASGLLYEIEYDSRQYPILRWQWKIDDIIMNGDATTKAGDDYAARIYVVFPSIFFWKTKALNYVWANHLPKNEATPNSFTANAMMVAVESGKKNVGKWLSFQRNINEDYKKYFGSEPPKVKAIAIMTDTDNTGGKAGACYGPIYIDSVEKNVPTKR